ncbi:P2Y purinoceptor 6 isoform X2 [Protopterus annectens]|uniref:P2Y purinoceptor 6 isoform X2 n=1 Tax=Protopterus annectens TaxID=7888 RepID=UPI001CF974E2|nr:P2Y purinoceptor 6 isoform X2 [Protopterus annectens]
MHFCSVVRWNVDENLSDNLLDVYFRELIDKTLKYGVQLSGLEKETSSFNIKSPVRMSLKYGTKPVPLKKADTDSEMIHKYYTKGNSSGNQAKDSDIM